MKRRSSNHSSLPGVFILLAIGAASLVLAESDKGLPPVPVPSDNPGTEVKIELGEELFMDRRLSGDGTVSCASCHVPEQAFTDGRPVAIGINGQAGTRNTPTILNVAYYEELFWDGRRSRLETQALDPLVNPIEHGLGDHEAVLQIVRDDADYRQRFKQAFGVRPQDIDIMHIGKAIAAFERTKVSGNSPFDKWWSGKGYKVSPSAERGFTLFFSKGRCISCHTMGMGTAIFTDNEYHNLGIGIDRIKTQLPRLAEQYRRSQKGAAGASAESEQILTEAGVSELGRFVVTLKEKDIGAFKTPSLRNVAVTAPYMHDGSLATLMDVIEFYDKGGNSNPYLDAEMDPLNLSDQEKMDLVAFLKTLTSPEFKQSADDQ